MSARAFFVIAFACNACATTDTASLKQSAAPEATAAARDYAAALFQCMKWSYVVPRSGNDTTKPTLVRVKVAPNGTFDESAVSQSSGASSVDDAVLSALRSCSGKVAPPESQREALQRDGLELAFRP